MNMNEEDFSSDSSDEDYVPEDHVDVSEEEDSGEDEDIPALDDADIDGVSNRNKGSGRKNAAKKTTKLKSVKDTTVSRRRRGGIRLEGDDQITASGGSDAAQAPVEQWVSVIEEVQEEEKKKKVDDLWADFMKDTVHARPKSSTNTSSSGAVSDSKSSTSASNTVTKPEQRLQNDSSSKEKVTIVKEFKFAGETVKMETTVDANSKEAKEHKASSTSSSSTSNNITSNNPATLGIKRPGGLSSVLGKLDKRPKMSTLVKSKLDWEGFKAKEGIDDELKIHNRGKDGYLERQAFLERTDHRQFEIERNIRLASATKRN